MSSPAISEIQISFMSQAAISSPYVSYTIGYSYDPDNLTLLEEKILRMALLTNRCSKDTSTARFTVFYALSSDLTALKISNIKDLIDKGFGTSEKPLYAFLETQP